MYPHCVVWTIWSERNLRTFDGVEGLPMAFSGYVWNHVWLVGCFEWLFLFFLWGIFLIYVILDETLLHPLCISCVLGDHFLFIFNKPLLFIQKIKIIHLIIDFLKMIFRYLYMGQNLLKIDFSVVAFRQAPLLLKLFVCFSLFHSEQWNKKGMAGGCNGRLEIFSWRYYFHMDIFFWIKNVLVSFATLAENKRISRFKIVPSKHDFKSAIDS